jgi:hypothetical protein
VDCVRNNAVKLVKTSKSILLNYKKIIGVGCGGTAPYNSNAKIVLR